MRWRAVAGCNCNSSDCNWDGPIISRGRLIPGDYGRPRNL